MCNLSKRGSRTVISYLAFLFLFVPFFAKSGPVIFTNEFEKTPFGRKLEVLVDSTGALNATNIVCQGKFVASHSDVPIFFLNDKTLWSRFSVTNRSKDADIFFSINYFNISRITLYHLNDRGLLDSLSETGNGQSFYSRPYDYLDYNFKLHLLPGQTGTYYFKVKSSHPIELAASLRTFKEIVAAHSSQALIIAGYLGVIISILLYNLFLFFATRDRSYFVYVLYLFALAAALLTLSGWSFKYLWPNYPNLNDFAVILTTSVATIAAISFAIHFLRTSTYLPKIHKFLLVIVGINTITILLSFTPFKTVAYQILNFSGIVFGVTLIYVSAAIYRKGYRPALYYLLAWSAFLVGLIIVVLRNINLLPTNNFTIYVLYAGSAIEAILLSIALADKITLLRRENELSQAEALRVSKENERLVKEQNVVLERKVAERTEELQEANDQVTLSYKNLKDAQIQLVEAEKMASLGQLTAGIAHEINNPINFVKSNIKPLQLDFNDLIEIIDEYEKLHVKDIDEISEHLKGIDLLKKDIGLDFVKEEITSLMKGIENGAERTAEIVRGLRNFSRLDESMIKTVDIHEGIDSTLILLRSNIPAYITIVKDYKANGNIECYPGKLNQVFMNIVSNAMQAIKAKPHKTNDESIVIWTKDISDKQIEIGIKDTGTGMSDEIKHRIFDPFFTTKDVGEGTGLGLAIVFKIVQEHHGKIEVISSEGNGAEFKLILSDAIPVKQIII
jgi:signal transduction histidine kinase